ncbi:DUF1980 domain-containing protein [Paenibacillus herberti]|uniref:DUF1980 domain-containing protein n=1 Tax=Paenibacillus herberti TaxID=1619309 RepID=A0A229NTF7_9BACL|nr:DUF1980 domain-containing protein [Paenibacillus herberti]OXM13102.1 hypothetical protein CGZ75_23300 [Paenibacillus herberti]
MLTERSILALHHLARAVVLGILSLTATFMARAGKLKLYVEPQMILVLKLSLLALFVLSLFQLFSAVQAWKGNNVQADCNCGGHSPPAGISQSLFLYALFLLPVLLGLI